MAESVLRIAVFTFVDAVKEASMNTLIVMGREKMALDPEDVRRTVWDMVDDGALELTLGQNFRRPPQHQGGQDDG